MPLDNTPELHITRTKTLTNMKRHIEEGIFELKKKPGHGLCPVKGCRNDLHPRKAGLCHRHAQHRWRLRDPKRSAYTALRDRARRRGLEFTITLDYFQGMLDCVSYWDHAAESRGECLSLDRIDATKGYVPGNLRIITISENVIKGNRERHLPEMVQSILARKRTRAKENPHLADEVEEKNPF